ncbi:MAG: hypothetical protein ABSD74_18860 [Rhizomicrobium sp.]|jgi:hypothetical protein
MKTISTVSFMIAPGKNIAAMKYLGEVAHHFKHVTGADIRILTQLAGPTGHVVLSSEHDNVGAWDAARIKFAADTGFQKMMIDAGSSGLFIAGSVTSALWQEV